MKKCNATPSKTIPAEFSELSDYATESLKCKTDLGISMTSFARAAACALCSGVDKTDKYFDKSGNPILT